MSLVIQKKKIPKNSVLNSSDRSLGGSIKDPIFQRYFKLLDELETNFRKQFSLKNYKSLKNLLDQFYKTLKNDQHFVTDLSKQGEELFNSPENVYLIRKVTGVLEVLSEYAVERKDKPTKEQQEANLTCIKILKVFAMLNPSFAMILSNQPTFLEKMFELMLEDNKIYFKQALYIQEALIAAKSGTLNKETYPIMSEIMSNMSKKYFARFSRIIALVVLENSDKMDFRELPCEFADNKMIRIHSFLLSIPNFILTYVQILEHLKDIMESLISTTMENVQKTITYLKESNLIKDSGINLSILKPLFDSNQVSENIVAEVFNPKFILRFVVKKSNITEILFVLSNLLSGKRKIDVQNILTEINFLERVIEPLLDILFHPDLELDNAEDMANNDSCHCSNPLATTRIQLLRVIINFCDRDTSNMHSKDLFISHEEKRLLYRQVIVKALKSHHFNYQEANSSDLNNVIDQMVLEPQDPSSPFFTEEMLTTNMFENVQDKGLLNKIISLLVKSHPNSNYRFWLASCVESFLRGFHKIHQIFVAHTGMIHELLDKVMTKKTTKSNNIQISYDLIGEIIKFNKYNVIFLEKTCEKFEWLKLLPYHASQNIIDSNVFLRALLLSYEKFDHQYLKQTKGFNKEYAYNFGKNSLLYQNFTEGNIDWFNLLIEAVEPNIINQDNICCVNTALIMAMFAEQRGELNKYFESLLVPRPPKCTREILEKFTKVLSIWQRYYMSKTKDSYSLKYTSALPFHYYQDMKERMQTFVDESLARLGSE